jgi:hypothetical protein
VANAMRKCEDGGSCEHLQQEQGQYFEHLLELQGLSTLKPDNDMVESNARRLPDCKARTFSRPGLYKLRCWKKNKRPLIVKLQVRL